MRGASSISTSFRGDAEASNPEFRVRSESNGDLEIPGSRPFGLAPDFDEEDELSYPIGTAT